jgi:nucleotide-binding universal stress UspA family protein
MEINDILVPTDFSECSLRALDFATRLLSPGGEIYLLNVIDSEMLQRFEEHGLGGKDEATEKLRSRAEGNLDQVITQREDAGAKLNKMIVVGVPFVEILRIAKDLDFGLIVMGVRGGGSPLQELLFGSTADKVLRGTNLPVLFVP